MVALTRVYHFSAAHCLSNPRLSPADNAVLYGQCARPHGHNYYLEVTVAGAPDPLTGFAVDLEANERPVVAVCGVSRYFEHSSRVPGYRVAGTAQEGVTRGNLRVPLPLT